MDHYCISLLKSVPHVDSLKLATEVFTVLELTDTTNQGPPFFLYMLFNIYQHISDCKCDGGFGGLSQVLPL